MNTLKKILSCFPSLKSNLKIIAFSVFTLLSSQMCAQPGVQAALDTINASLRNAFDQLIPPLF